MDHITLRSIELLTRIGVDNAERTNPQRILVDLELRHPLKSAGVSDDLGESIDYRALTQAVVALGEGERKTVEKLAEDIAALILNDFTPESGVTVTVTKMPDLPLASASVTIERP